MQTFCDGRQRLPRDLRYLLTDALRCIQCGDLSAVVERDQIPHLIAKLSHSSQYAGVSCEDGMQLIIIQMYIACVPLEYVRLYPLEKIGTVDAVLRERYYIVRARLLLLAEIFHMKYQ